MHTLLSLLLFSCADKGGDTGADGGAPDGGAEDGGAGDGGAGDGGGVEPGVTELGCEERHDALLAAFEAELASYGISAASLAVMEDGAVTCRAARGVRGDGATPADLDTLFQLGSTTKMFTSVALLQKVEAGELALDTTLAEAYPDSEFALDADWNDAVQMQHLLTHQGSFYDYLDPLDTGDDAGLAAWHRDVFFPYLWLMTDPGWFWNYANPNFDLMGLVVEGLDGRWYADVMQQDVFQPLGMDRTFLRRSEVEADGNYALGEGYIYQATGNVVAGQATRLNQVPDPASARPAGYHTWSTPSQVLEMVDFLVNGDEAVLRDDLRQAMTEPQVEVPIGFLFPFAEVTHYGYGVMVGDGFALSEDEAYDVEIWSHGGNTNLYTSDLYVLPQQGFAISVLSAGYGTGFYDTVATALSTLATLPAPHAREELVVDLDAIDRHVGTYDDPYNVGQLIVTRDGDGLAVEMPLLAELGYVIEPALVPLTTDTWLVYLDGNPYDITFAPGPDPDRSGFAVNRAFAGARVDAELRMAAPLGAPRLDPTLVPVPWQRALDARARR